MEIAFGCVAACWIGADFLGIPVRWVIYGIVFALAGLGYMLVRTWWNRKKHRLPWYERISD